MNSVLQVRNLSKTYGANHVVRDVSLDIESGELFALLGPSGCGKTTVLRMVAGFEIPNRGEVLLSGKNIAQLKPYERSVSTVFQNYALFPHLTARQNIEFGLRHKGAANGNLAERTAKVLELVQMAGKEERYPARLSGGEKQRIALARSLAIEPDLLLLDEPLSALDPKLRKQVRGELKDLQRRVGITFIIVTHDQEEAMAMADRVALMNKGVLEQIGTPEDIYLRPKTRFVASFLGSVNWRGEYGVRPEAVRVTSTPPGNGARSQAGRIHSSLFLGNCFHVEARLDDGTSLVAEIPRLDQSFSPGESVHLWWHAQDEIRLPQ
jgi:spermidine/putrescine transport system ATP-binding protein